MQPDDSELLRRYLARDEAAFRALVERRFELVYAVALRQVGGDTHLATDVAQRVFAELARQAGRLAGRPTLSGWLYRAARYSAIDVARAEIRRRKRELEASIMREADDVSDVQWQQVRPLLDEAISALGDAERDALLWRVVEDRPYAELARRLGVSADAARMRVERALEKLQVVLRRRGVSSTSTALAMALANQAVASVPAGLATTVASSVLAGQTGGAVMVGGIAGFMSGTKLAGTVIAGFALLAAGWGVFRAHERRDLEAEASRAAEEVASLRARLASERRMTLATTQPGGVASPSTSAERPAAEAVSDAEVARMREAYEAGKRLRMEYPSYQGALLRSMAIGARLDYIPFYRKHRLSDEQREAFEAILGARSAAEMDRVDAARTIGLAVDDPSLKALAKRQDAEFQERLRSVLGEAVYTDFREFARLRPIRELVSQLAAEVSTTIPLTAEQTAQLTRIVAQRHPHLQSLGFEWQRDNIDWAATVRDARAMLYPLQAEVWEGVVARLLWSNENIRRLNERTPR